MGKAELLQNGTSGICCRPQAAGGLTCMKACLRPQAGSFKELILHPILKIRRLEIKLVYPG
jgi:hypothetical protein